MPRFEIVGDPIRVAYGYDFPVPGVFLSVYDKRLEYDGDASSEVNAVTDAIGVKDGGGSYFDLHTGVSGFGRKVDDKTMATFLKRYGVTDEQIRVLPLQLGTENTRTSDGQEGARDCCSVCNKNTSNQCSRCGKVRYCSKECQGKAWPVHKLFCGLREDHDDSGGSLQALFLPENEDTPQLVRIPLVREHDEDYAGSFWRIDTSMYIDGMQGVFRSDFFPNQDPSWPDAYHILYKDNFLRDGSSTENACLKRIVEKVAKSAFGSQRQLPRGSKEMNRGPPIHFKGNLLVVKAEKSGGPFLSGECNYLDVNLTDTDNIASMLYRANLDYITTH